MRRNAPQSLVSAGIALLLVSGGGCSRAFTQADNQPLGGPGQLHLAQYTRPQGYSGPPVETNPGQAGVAAGANYSAPPAGANLQADNSVPSAYPSVASAYPNTANQPGVPPLPSPSPGGYPQSFTDEYPPLPPSGYQQSSPGGYQPLSVVGPAAPSSVGIATQSPDGYLSTLNGPPPSPGPALGQDLTTLPNGSVVAPSFGATLPPPGQPLSVQPNVGGQSLVGEEEPAADFGVVERFKWRFREDEGKLWIDAENYLSWTTLAEMAAALGTDALLANTPLDQKFQDWFQNHVRNKATDRFSNSIAFLGHGQDMIPAAIGLTVAGTLVGDNWLGDTVGDFGNETCRAYLIGVPSLLLFQYGLARRAPATATRSTAPIGGRWATMSAPAAMPSSAPYPSSPPPT